MSSTSGLHAGNLLAEISRLRALLERSRRSRRAAAHSRDVWKQRALDAEAILADQRYARRSWDRRKAA